MKMKLILFTICFGAVAIMFANATKQVRCFGDDHFLESISLVESKTTQQVCAFGCMLSASDMMKPKGMFNYKNFRIFLKKSKIYNYTTKTKFVEVLKACKKQRRFGTDICENVEVSVSCLLEEAHKNGLGVNTMLDALESTIPPEKVAKPVLQFFFLRYG